MFYKHVFESRFMKRECTHGAEFKVFFIPLETRFIKRGLNIFLRKVSTQVSLQGPCKLAWVEAFFAVGQLIVFANLDLIKRKKYALL